MVDPKPGERIAVLGPRRLGMLAVAALAGVRAGMRARGQDFTVAAVVRDPALLPLAAQFGATEGHLLGDGVADGAFDVVIDTTGNPDGLLTALRLARREVHLKSTHGQPAGGVRHLTEMVVDELGLAPFPADEPPAGAADWDRLRTGRRPRVAWLSRREPPAWLLARADVRRGTAPVLAAQFTADADGLPRADVAVADDAAGVDAAVRPRAGSEEPLVRPRGLVLLHPQTATAGAPLLDAVVRRGLRLSTSRCGEFAPALALLASDPELARIGERLVTHRFRGEQLAEAFATARSRGCIKAVVAQEAP
jgi:hypothetical protein